MGDDVTQPGPGDVAGRSGKIAELAGRLSSISRAGIPNRVDAAIARVTRQRQQLDSRGRLRSRGDELLRSSKTCTFAKWAKQRSDGWHRLFPSAKIMLPHMKTAATQGTVRYRDQVVCNSLRLARRQRLDAIVNDQNQVVSLHAAGSFEVSTFNKIEHVFSLLGLDLA